MRRILLVHLVLFCLLNHGFPRPACQDVSASASRMLACHFESSLDLMIFPAHRMNWTGFAVEAELLLGDNDNAGTTKGTKLSIVQVIIFCVLVKRGVSPFFHSYEHACSEQSFPSDRTGGVSSSDCTVASKSRSCTYTCASSFACTSPFAVTNVVGFWTFSKYPVHPSSNPSCSTLSL